MPTPNAADGTTSQPERPALTLTVLGCDGSWPGPGGAGSGYLLSTGSTRVVLDAGPGCFATLQRLVDPSSIDAVVLTHRHSDHWTDLYCLDTHARLVLGRTGIPVFAPAELRREAGRLAERPTFEWHTVGDRDSVEIGDLACAFRRTDHPVETLAVRVEGGGRALGYSADSGPGWSLADLGTDLDLALCEATYTVEHEGSSGHLSGRQAGQQGRLARAQRLVLTHRWPTIGASEVAAEASRTFDRSVEQASIGAEFVL